MSDGLIFFLIQVLNGIQYGLLLFLVASGLTLVFDLDDDLSVALAEQTPSGQRMLAVARSGPRPPSVAVDALLRPIGSSLTDVSEVRAVGSGATDATTVGAVARKIGRSVRAVDDPRHAVAVGALAWAAGQAL